MFVFMLVLIAVGGGFAVFVVVAEGVVVERVCVGVFSEFVGQSYRVAGGGVRVEFVFVHNR